MPNNRTKDELLAMMNHYLDLQIEIAQEKEREYRRVEENGAEPQDKKHKNPYQNELNNQIDAIIRSCSALIRINNSTIASSKKVIEDEQEERAEEVQEEELV